MWLVVHVLAILICTCLWWEILFYMCSFLHDEVMGTMILAEERLLWIQSVCSGALERRRGVVGHGLHFFRTKSRMLHSFKWPTSPPSFVAGWHRYTESWQTMWTSYFLNLVRKLTLSGVLSVIEHHSSAVERWCGVMAMWYFVVWIQNSSSFLCLTYFLWQEFPPKHLAIYVAIIVKSNSTIFDIKSNALILAITICAMSVCSVHICYLHLVGIRTLGLYGKYRRWWVRMPLWIDTPLCPKLSTYINYLALGETCTVYSRSCYSLLDRFYHF